MEQIVLLKLNDKREKYDKNIDPKINGNEVAKRIGSEFKKGTRDTIRGLDSTRERIYLPIILGLQPSDADFPIKCKDFWSDFTLTPTADGLRLNIATTKTPIKLKRKNDKGEEVEVEEFIETPENWDDYIAYQFAMQSSQVAKGEDLKNLGFFDFYLIDLAKENQKKVSDFEVQDKADNYYAKLAIEDKWEQNKNKIDWIIELMRDKRQSINLDSMTITEKKMLLHGYKTKTPALFISFYEEDNLDLKAFVSKCISNRVITKEGNNLFYKDEAIGDADLATTHSAVAWLKNPINSGKVQHMKSILEDTIKNKRES